MTGIHCVKRKVSGGTRYHYYAYRGGPRFWVCDNTPVPDPAPRKFRTAYDAALRAFPREQSDNRPTINWLIEDFKTSGEYRRLTKSTKASYETGFKAIRATFGNHLFTHFANPKARGVVKRWHDSMSDKPRTADLNLATLVRLLNAAVDDGHIISHCANKIASLHRADRSEIIWQPDEMDALLTACTTDNAAWTIRFIAATGFRRAAACACPTTAVKDGYIEWAYGRGKKRIEVCIPVTADIAACLNWFDSERNRLGIVAVPTICFSRRGRPWTAGGLSTAFQDARRSTGVDKRLHDLRGTAVTRYYEAGFAAREIAGFIGWNEATVDDILGRYVHRPTIMRENVIRLARGSKP